MKNITESKATIEGLAFLIESSMERAELVMAAKSITDKLQAMAETLAKIEASDVMPMMDSMKENFGPQVAQKFETTVTAKLRALTETLRLAKDDIGTEIVRMEASVNGEPVSDMEMADEMPTPEADTLTAPEDAAAPADAPTGEDDIGNVPSDEELESMFADAEGDDSGEDISAGRVRKESVEARGASVLRESANPDLVVMRTFARLIREGRDTVKAATGVAAFFGIDASDVVDIVRDYRKA